MELQKQMPFDVDLESAIVGAIMLEPDSLVEVSDFLLAKMFYVNKYANMYEACYSLFRDNKPVDILTVTKWLREQGRLNNELTPYDITHTTTRVSSSANVEYHARLISEMYIKREIYKHSRYVSDKSIEEGVDVFALIEYLNKGVDSALGDVLTGEAEQIDKIIDQAKDLILSSSNYKVSGVTSGIFALDQITSGFQPSDMIVLAARPAMGKSALMTTMIKSAAKSGKPCAIFSLEMSKFQLVCRLVSEEVKISANELVKRQLTDYQKKMFRDSIDSIRHLPIHIDDDANLSITQLRAKIKRMKKKYDIQFAVIDYLQLMSGGKNKGGREQEISEISRGIKLIAKELNIPVIALSQLSRAVETRGGDKIPMLSDLRESGSIEQDADMVIFLYRPYYYGIEQDENGQSTKGMCDIIIAKHRNGELGVVKSEFIGQYTCFKDWNTNEYNSFPKTESKF